MATHLNIEQQFAKGQVLAFLERDNESVFLLKGYAGTGKTFLIGNIVQTLKMQKREVVLCTPTGRAARVLSDKTLCEASTIHSKIYKASSVDASTDDPEVLVWSFDLKQNEDSVNAVYIVDEASMVADNGLYEEEKDDSLQFGSGRLLFDYLNYVGIVIGDNITSTKRKVIFVGDPAQLPPVGSPNSPALSAEYLLETYKLKTTETTLTQVVRQTESGFIIKNATSIRKSIQENIYNYFKIETGNDVNEIDNEYLQLFEQDEKGDFPLLVTATNLMAFQHNMAIRRFIYQAERFEILPGDRLLIVANNKHYMKLNGDMGTIRGAVPGVEVRQIRLKNVKDSIDLKFRNIRIHFDSDPENVISECKVLENVLWSDQRQLSRQELTALRVDFEQRTSLKFPPKRLYKENREDYILQRDLYIDKLRVDPYFNALQVKFGYAVTCHKAQGGEWKRVIVDFRSAPGGKSEGFYRWSYTAVTRAAVTLYTMFAPSYSPWSALSIKKAEIPLTQNISGISVTPGLAFQRDRVEHFENPICNQIHLAILRKLHNTDIVVSDVQSLHYRQRYVFKQAEVAATIDFIYSAKGKVTPKTLKSNSEDFIVYLMSLLGKIESVSMLAVNNDKSDFPHPFLKSWNELLEAKLHSKTINILKVDHISYAERYYFQRNDELSVMDFFYNNQQMFTQVVDRPSLGNSADLSVDIHEIIESGDSSEFSKSI